MKPIKYNKYGFVPDLVIDLHGMTVLEAREELVRTLNNKGTKKIRIITGKGSHSAGGVAVIRDEAKKVLAARGLSWKYAKLHEGGEGVLDVG